MVHGFVNFEIFFSINRSVHLSGSAQAVYIHCAYNDFISCRPICSSSYLSESSTM